MMFLNGSFDRNFDFKTFSFRLDGSLFLKYAGKMHNTKSVCCFSGQQKRYKEIRVYVSFSVAF